MNYEERQERNDRSRNGAEHHAQPWDNAELEVLRLWDREDNTLTALAELLGRTREACRQMYYLDRRGAQTRTYRKVRTVTTRTETTTTVQVYNFCPDCHLDPCCC